MTEYYPGFRIPGGKNMLANPVEHGYVPVPAPEAPVIDLVATDIELPLPAANPPRIDWNYLHNLTSIPGNEYEERKAA